MIRTEGQHEMVNWLCERIGLVPSANIRCIGRSSHGELVGVVGYDGYNGASVMLHVASEGNWLTKDLLYAVFDYPFNVCKVNMVIGLVPSGNAQALRFNTHIGFKTKQWLHGAHPDGALVLMTMAREECRYLKQRIRHGQEEQTSTSCA